MLNHEERLTLHKGSYIFLDSLVSGLCPVALIRFQQSGIPPPE